MLKKIKSYFYSYSFIPRLNYPIYYRLKDKSFYRWPIIAQVLKFLCSHNPSVTDKYCDAIINERIIELPFIFREIDKLNANILDVGCDESVLSIHLANAGHKVTAVDLNNYAFKHPNLNFIKGNITNITLPEANFDYVIFLSTLEHIGLGVYHEDSFSNGDKTAIKNISRFLKPDGKLLVTVPFGKGETAPKQRIYDKLSIAAAFEDYDIEKEDYYYGKNQQEWLKVSSVELQDVRSNHFTQGVALLCLRKKI